MKTIKIATLATMFGFAGMVFALAAEPVKIAFVDTGNTGRSVTAEAIARQYIVAKHLAVAVISRGVDVDTFTVLPEPNAATLLKAHGMDVSQHEAHQVTINDVHHADVILTMTAGHRDRLIAAFPEAKDKTFILGEYATGKPSEIADAYGKPMPVYEDMYARVNEFAPLAIDKAVATIQKK